MSRILKGCWDCTYCGYKRIDGLADACPNCGRFKSADIKYYLPVDATDVTSEELARAGKTYNDCDGTHKDWICPVCSTLNKFNCNTCVSCGTPKSQAVHQYGYEKINSSRNNITQEPVMPALENTDTAYADEQYDSMHSTALYDSPCETEYKSPRGNNMKSTWQKIHDCVTDEEMMTIVVTGFVACAIIFLIAFFFMPIESHVKITGFSWERCIIIEEERTVDEHDWSVPAGGRVYDTSWEIRCYEQVLDHYETRYRTVSEQVIDHYDTYYNYIDNGDGTFTEQPYDVPVYRTDYYDEPYQEPVYRQEPVYDTMYYYEIERWFTTDTLTTSGNDKNPYWYENYELGDCERDTTRLEHYYVIYDDDSSETVDYATWQNMNIGDGYKIIRNRLGMTYKRTQADGCADRR